jgi:hypothetical protein
MTALRVAFNNFCRKHESFGDGKKMPTMARAAGEGLDGSRATGGA